MKHMADLDLEDKYIRIFPGDSVKKWGIIKHVTSEGIIVIVTYVDQGSWADASGWIVGTTRFISWHKLDFYFCDSMEANSGRRS